MYSSEGRFRTSSGRSISRLNAPAASAQTTVFSDFGPRNTFNTLGGAIVSGPDSSTVYTFGAYFSVGYGFTASAGGTLSTIHIAIGHQNGTNDAHLFLARDTGGVPGQVLESFTLTDLPKEGAPFTPELITSVSHPILSSGVAYFLYEVEPGDEFNNWNQNSIAEQGPTTHTEDDPKDHPFSTYTDFQGAFSVQVNAAPAAVPEASTTVSFGLLLTLGLCGVGIAARKRAKA